MAGFNVFMNEFSYIKGAYGKTIEDVIRNIFIEVYYHINGPEILSVIHLVCLPKNLSAIARMIINQHRADFLSSINRTNTLPTTKRGGLADTATVITLEQIPTVICDIAKIAKEMNFKPVNNYGDVELGGQETDVIKCLEAEYASVRQSGKFFYKWRSGKNFAKEFIKLAYKS